MRRPTKIRVFGKTYKVVGVVPHDERLEGNNALCDPDNQVIYIADGLPLETEQDYLWHEIKHAVEASMGLNLKDIVIQKMATGELAVFKDNPSLLRYLAAKK